MNETLSHNSNNVKRLEKITENYSIFVLIASFAVLALPGMGVLGEIFWIGRPTSLYLSTQVAFGVIYIILSGLVKRNLGVKAKPYVIAILGFSILGALNILYWGLMWLVAFSPYLYFELILTLAITVASIFTLFVIRKYR